jgi:hypothetical protein
LLFLISSSILFPVCFTDSTTLVPNEIETLEDWTYRKSHIISGSDGAGTDYQIRLQVHFDEGEDSGDDVYCFRQCQPDFDDIRFTDDDGSTLLSYWLESYSWAGTGVFWIRVSDNLDFSTTIFMYYGNPTARTVSNGPDTFIHFDDFETGYGWGNTESQMENLGWTVEDGLRDTVSVGGCPGGVPGSCLHVVDATGAYNTDFEIHWNRINGVAVHMDLYFAEPEDWWRVTFGGGSYAITSVNFRNGMEFFWQDGSWNPPFSIQEDTWQELEFQATVTTFDVVADGTRHVAGVVDNIVSEDEGYTFFVFEGCWGDNYYVDNVYVRKFVLNQPVHSMWIVEPGMAPTLGPEAPPEPIDLGFLVPGIAVAGVGVVAVAVLVFLKKRAKHRRSVPPSSGIEIS